MNCVSLLMELQTQKTSRYCRDDVNAAIFFFLALFKRICGLLHFLFAER